MSTSFLSLPYELRQMIYKDFITDIKDTRCIAHCDVIPCPAGQSTLIPSSAYHPFSGVNDFVKTELQAVLEKEMGPFVFIDDEAYERGINLCKNRPQPKLKLKVEMTSAWKEMLNIDVDGISQERLFVEKTTAWTEMLQIDVFDASAEQD